MNLKKNKYISVMPIVSDYRDKSQVLSGRIAFADGVALGQLPAWMREATITKFLSFQHKNELESSSYAFFYDYQVDQVFTDEGMEIIQKKFLLANLALWLAKPTLCNGFMITHAEYDGSWSIKKQSTLRTFSVHEGDIDNCLEKGDVTSAIELHRSLIGIDTGPLWIAIGATIQALAAPFYHWQGRYLQLWIALEAIFGSNYEIAHRISERIAFFTSVDRDEVREQYRQAKKAYDIRSKTVHGASLDKLKYEESALIMHRVECFLRSALKKILLNPEILKNINGEKREIYLDDVIFS